MGIQKKSKKSQKVAETSRLFAKNLPDKYTEEQDRLSIFAAKFWSLLWESRLFSRQRVGFIVL